MSDFIELEGLAKHGLDLYSEGNKQEAIDYWHDVLELHPNDKQCQNYLDIAVLEVPQNDSGTLINEIVVESLIPTQSFDELYLAAMSAYTQRHYSEAEILFEQCLVLRHDERVRHNLERLRNR
ncbi:MAG: hypothetical protein GQ582_00135 [Methyloprofundus sp.]|nr:hypothetical protein [Methyloprofundus sp.]